MSKIHSNFAKEEAFLGCCCFLCCVSLRSLSPFLSFLGGTKESSITFQDLDHTYDVHDEDDEASDTTPHFVAHSAHICFATKCCSLLFWSAHYCLDRFVVLCVVFVWYSDFWLSSLSQNFFFEVGFLRMVRDQSFFSTSQFFFFPCFSGANFTRISLLAGASAHYGQTRSWAMVHDRST